MHAKSGLRVVLKWTIAASGSVIAVVILLILMVQQKCNLVGEQKLFVSASQSTNATRGVLVDRNYVVYVERNKFVQRLKGSK